MKEKDKSKISVLIIPKSQKVKRISIPSWLPKTVIWAISIVLVILSAYIGLSRQEQAKLAKNANEKSDIILSLEEESKNKDEKLNSLISQNNELRKKTEEVENKLNEIEDLQRRLEKMAGVESPSRGGSLNRARDLELFTEDNYISEMNILVDVLDNKMLELEVFIEDVEAKFEYLDSLPDTMPASGRITSKFGNRKDPFTKRIAFHSGIDIANSSGTNIKASSKGKVIFAASKGAYGKTVIIDHGYGHKTLYAHNKQILVKVGDLVEKGQIISKMGSTGRSTGTHLHFEIHKNNTPINPLNMLNN